MRSVDELVQEAKELPRPEQERLVLELGKILGTRDPDRAPASRPGLKGFLDLMGTAEVTARDVSSDKYRHLAEIYSGDA